MIIVGRRMSQKDIAAATDEVVVGYPLPSGCELRQIDLSCSIIGTSEMTVIQAQMYGLTGMVVPVFDPDTPITLDVLWDQRVPKDAAFVAGSFDLQELGTDTTPEFNFGEPNVHAIFGQAGNVPLEIFRRRRLLTFPNSPVGFERVDAAPDLWQPVDFFSSRITGRVRPDRHSHIMFGFSSPDMSQTTQTVESTLEETEWTMMTYLEQFLEYAFVNLMGLVEAGAETPYAESMALVAQLVEDVVLEDVGGAFQVSTFTVYTQATFQVDVPGRFRVGVLTSE